MAESSNGGKGLWFSLLFAAGLISLISFAGFNSGLLTYPDSSAQPGELDLSGAWKISFVDDPSFSLRSTDDSTWCLITVPDATISAQASPGDRPSASCPTEAYPKERMRNASFWYRKAVTIPEGSAWRSPSVFLGAVKDEAWVYWDGALIGSGRTAGAPLYFLLSPAQAHPGHHVLAVRVLADTPLNPGIYHAYVRKVALGEYSRSAAASTQLRVQGQYLLFPIFTNGIAFLLLLFLLVRTARAGGTALALLAYFGFSTAYSIPPSSDVLLNDLMNQLSFIGIPLSALAYAVEITIEKDRRNRAHRALGVIAALLSCSLIVSFLNHSASFIHDGMPSYVAAISLLYFVAVIIPGLSRLRRRLRDGSLARRLGTLVALVAVLTISFVNIIKGGTSLNPTRILTSVLTLFVVLLAIEDHITQERRLAFFGRFLRKGLKQLLSGNFKRVTGGEKIFQGRKIPVMALDIENHTKTTYGMPFGMKRTFQDLWFTTVDKVMENKTFMDKGLGDGSLYYFEELQKGGGCRAALECALTIRSQAIADFDQRLSERLRDLLARNSELSLPSQKFLKQYEAKNGISFWHRKTRVRMVLAYGFADEGLWGLHELGHYDIEGDLVTLTARLEKHAGSNEIIMTRPFYDALVVEWPEAAHFFAVEWRTAELKGIGPHDYGLLRAATEASLAA